MTQTFRWTPKGNEVFESNLEHIPNTCYHVTSRDRVDSILNEGLIPGSKRNTKFGKSRGVYFITDPLLLCDDAMDSFEDGVVLEVDVSSFKHLLRPDPEWRSSENGNPMHCEEDFAWYAKFVIDAKYIQVQAKR